MNLAFSTGSDPNGASSIAKQPDFTLARWEVLSRTSIDLIAASEDHKQVVISRSKREAFRG